MAYDWKQLLTPVSQKLIETADTGDINWLGTPKYNPDGEKVLSDKWLGYPGATEPHITQAEARLGKVLPPDYRQFLALTNGWRNFRHYPFGLVSLLPVAEIDWFVAYDHRKNIGRVESWLELKAEGKIPDTEDNPPEEHFRATLLIGESDGNECLLLNPFGMSAGGEWECWIYHNETGIAIYPSFWELMQAYTSMCVDNLDHGRWWML